MKTHEVGHASRSANLLSVAESSLLASGVASSRNTARDGADEGSVAANALGVHVAAGGQSLGDARNGT
jgi:hypothetical protein